MLSIFFLSCFINALAQNSNTTDLSTAIAKRTSINIDKIENAVTVFQRYNSLIKNIRAQSTDDKKKQRQQMSALKQSMQVELATILDKEELSKFQQALSIEMKLANSILSEEERKTMYKAINDYLNKNSFPFVKDERLRLDKLLVDSIKLKIKNDKEALAIAQKELKVKQKECRQAKARERRKCNQTQKQIREELKQLNQNCKTYLQNNNVFSDSYKKIKAKKHSWEEQVSLILKKYYKDLDTAQYPIKANNFLKHTNLLGYAFINTERLELFYEDFSTYGKINSLNVFKQSPTIFFELEKKGNVTFQVINVNNNIEQTVNEGVLERGLYNSNLAKDLPKGLYFVRMLIYGTQANVIKLVIH